MTVRVVVGHTLDSLREMPAGTFQTCVTSPPYYGLRSYVPDGHPDKPLEIGLEDTPDAYVARLVEVFGEVRRVLRDDGTLWLNLGDSYASKPVGTFNGGGFKDKSAATGGRDLSGVATSGRVDKVRASGCKEKDLLLIPHMVAFALRADGWYLRSAIVWAKPNPMPESVRDRPTSSYEMVFLLTKAARYFYDAEAISEAAEQRDYADWQERKDAGEPTRRGFDAAMRPGNRAGVAPRDGRRNARNVWTIATQPYSGAHFATMPPDLAERCIRAGSKPGDHVLDPFGGAGTTGLVADRLGRHATLCELNPAYADIARERIAADAPLLGTVA